MTAPHNLIPYDSRAVKGAGSAAIESVIELSANSGRAGKVRLTALRDAVPFYEKIGFSIKQDYGLPEMDLGSDAAQEFLKVRGKLINFSEDELNNLEDLALGALAMLPSPQQTEFAEAEPKDATDQIAEKARPLIGEAIAPWLTTITNFVEQAQSLEEIRDGLVDLYPELDGAAFAEAMGQAMLLGDLAGRELVLSEAEVEVLGDDAASAERLALSVAEGSRSDVAFAQMLEAAIAKGTIEFAASSGKKPNCNAAKSHFCQTPNGRGTCVPLSKKCKLKPEGNVKAAADFVDSKSGKTKTLKTQVKTGKDQIDPILHDFYDFTKTGGTLTPDETMLAETALGVETQSSYQQSKIAKLKKDDLTPLEAAAVENYIGSGYGEMNAALYNPVGYQEGFGPKGWQEEMAVNKLAVNGLKKIDKVKESDMLELAETHNINYKKGDPLVRTLTISDLGVLEDYIKKHKDAKSSDGPIVVEQFMSTTFKQGGLDHFATGANVTIKVKAKLDGNGSGVLVDKYKNKAFESEVLFPPMSEFKVTKVRRTKKGTPPETKVIEKEVYTPKYKELKTAYTNILTASSMASYAGASTTGILGKGSQALIKKYLPEGYKLADLNKKAKVKEMTDKMKIEIDKESKKTKTVKEAIETPGTPDSYLIEYEEI